MGIFDLLAEHKSKKAYFGSRKAAIDHFVKQKSAIQGISDTPWLQEIKNYFVLEFEAGTKRLLTAKGTELHEVQGSTQLAADFLQFLDNLINAPKE